MPEMDYSEKIQNALQKSALCIGLDTDIQKLPSCLRQKPDAIFCFNDAIIEATLSYAGAYKINFAFYEALGTVGWSVLQQTVASVRRRDNGILLIADAKRGDIGNTAEHYAHAILNDLDFDCITVNAYMGYDSVEPFIRNPRKGAFILCLTSNPGSSDFQYFNNGTVNLYEHVARKAVEWNRNHNCGLVVGATHPDEMQRIREIAGEMPFLIPGIGAQGGDLESSVRINSAHGNSMALINVSRAILYASTHDDFADAAGKAAETYYKQIVNYLKKSN